jgi:cytosine permease
VVDYFILKRYRKELEESRLDGRLPKEVEDWNPIAIVSLVLAFLVGYFYKGGLNQALNSLIAGMIFYFVLMKVYMAFSPARNAKFIKKSEAGEV